MAVTLSQTDKHSSLTLSNGDLSVSRASTSPLWAFARATETKKGGKWYWEVTVPTLDNHKCIGIADKTESLEVSSGTNATKTRVINQSRQSFYPVNTSPALQTAWTTPTVIGLMLDLDVEGGKLNFLVNGIKQTFEFINFKADIPDPLPVVGLYGTNTLNLNFGASEFDLKTRNNSLYNQILNEGFKAYGVMTKSLIKVGADLKTLQNGELVTVTPQTDADWKNLGMTDLSPLFQSISKVDKPMTEGATVGTGKINSVPIDKSKYKILGMGVK